MCVSIIASRDWLYPVHVGSGDFFAGAFGAATKRLLAELFWRPDWPTTAHGGLRMIFACRFGFGLPDVVTNL
jgi:hypothetical protein